MKNFNEFLKTIDFEKLYNQALDSTGMSREDRLLSTKEEFELLAKASQGYAVKLLGKYHDWLTSQE